MERFSTFVNPALSTESSVVDALFATSKALTPELVDELHTVSFAYGLVVPRPTFSEFVVR
jgi:hypothetical protein